MCGWSVSGNKTDVPTESCLCRMVPALLLSRAHTLHGEKEKSNKRCGPFSLAANLALGWSHVISQCLSFSARPEPGQCVRRFASPLAWTLKGLATPGRGGLYQPDLALHCRSPELDYACKLARPAAGTELNKGIPKLVKIFMMAPELVVGQEAW